MLCLFVSYIQKTTVIVYINLSLILLSRGSGVRIPPGSPVLRILLDVGSFLCGRDAIAKTFASPMAPKGLSLPLSLLDHQVNRRIVQIELSAFCEI